MKSGSARLWMGVAGDSDRMESTGLYVGVVSCSEGEGCSDGKQSDGEGKTAQPQHRERGTATGLQMKRVHRRRHHQKARINFLSLYAQPQNCASRRCSVAGEQLCSCCARLSCRRRCSTAAVAGWRAAASRQPGCAAAACTAANMVSRRFSCRSCGRRWGGSGGRGLVETGAGGEEGSEAGGTHAGGLAAGAGCCGGLAGGACCMLATAARRCSGSAPGCCAVCSAGWGLEPRLSPLSQLELLQGCGQAAAAAADPAECAAASGPSAAGAAAGAPAAACTSCSMLMRRSTATGDGGSGRPSNRSSRPCSRSWRCCLSWQSHRGATCCRLQAPASRGWVGQAREECAFSRKPSQGYDAGRGSGAAGCQLHRAQPHPRSQGRWRAACGARCSWLGAEGLGGVEPAGWPAAAGVGGRRSRRQVDPARRAGSHGPRAPAVVPQQRGS